MNYKKLFLITPKDNLKPVLNYLYVKNGKVYATDSFKAIIMNSTFTLEKEGFITKIDAIVADEKSKDFKALPELVDVKEKYPEIETVIPEEDFVLSYDRKSMIDLLTAMQKGGKFDEIKISIPKDRQKALVLKNDNGTGIIMPHIR